MYIHIFVPLRTEKKFYRPLKNETLIQMKKHLFITGCVTLALTLFLGAGIKPTTFTVDTKASTINWHGYKTMKPQHKHEGTVMLESGTIILEDERITGGSFTIDMSSIKEISENENMAARLVKHLHSADFFHVAKFPAATFVITEVTPEGIIKGNLSVLGATKSIDFPASIALSSREFTATANFELNLGVFGVPYMQEPADEEAKAGAVSPVVKFSLNIVAKK